MPPGWPTRASRTSPADRGAGSARPRTLIRSPMLSQVDAVVRCATVSLNSEAAVLAALSAAAGRAGTTHAVVLMVELGDLREGVLAEALGGLALTALLVAAPGARGHRHQPRLSVRRRARPGQHGGALAHRRATWSPSTGVGAVGGLRRQLRQPRLGHAGPGRRAGQRAEAGRGHPARRRSAHADAAGRAAHGRLHRRGRAHRGADEAVATVGETRPGRLRGAACSSGERPDPAGDRRAGSPGRRPARA